MLIILLLMELTMKSTSILFTVLKKGMIYALVAVSMNLLNGFTGLFSLGQAGFMLIGAYTYAIFSMPTSIKLGESVYKYYDCAISLELGIFPSLLLAGIFAAVFAALIGLPVLRLKSDYLAIATLGFAEILRAFFQWDAMGPVTNGANVLRQYKDLTKLKIPFTNVSFPPTLFPSTAVTRSLKQMEAIAPAVYSPIPGSFLSSAAVRGKAPPYSDTIILAHLCRFRARE